MAWLRRMAGTGSCALLAVGILVGTLGGLGCTALSSSDSVSGSSKSISSIPESISDSVSNSVSVSESSANSSSSSSSGDDGDSAAIRNDVRTYTALFSEAGGDVDAYLAGVGALCERHAITRWQDDPAIHRAIGEGLAETEWSDARASEFAIRVAGDDPAALATIRAATASGR